METLRAKFRIVTPMFISGADQTKAELRLPSIKGALRFWWRALAFARCGDLKRLSEEEDALFGSTNSQARVLMKLLPSQLDSTPKGGEHNGLKPNPGALYFGYGVVEPFDGKTTRKGRLIRPCLNESQEFDVLVRGSDDDLGSASNAIKALGLLGGIGSKARKGYGSLTLISLSRGDTSLWQQPEGIETYRSYLAKLLADCEALSSLPPFSAFSTFARVDWLVEGGDPLRLLDQIGRSQQRYRSWGRNGIVNDQPSEKNFEEDHDWSKNNRPAGFHPKRVVFGLPHNYGKGRDMQVGPASSKHDRRASPMFLHVQHLGDHRYAGISTLLEAEFLPSGEQVNAGGIEVAQRADYSILTNWLEAGGPSESPKPYFPGRERLWP
jgi:CRISPR-associated protein Cmr1